MVTFECTFMQMMKNAILCAVAHLPMAIFHTILSVAIVVVMSFAVYPGIVIVFNFVLGLCLTRYPMEFYATRVIEKLIKSQKKETVGVNIILPKDVYKRLQMMRIDLDGMPLRSLCLQLVIRKRHGLLMSCPVSAMMRL